MDYGYSSSSMQSAGIIGTIMGLISLVIFIVTVIATWKIFVKWGEKGWKILIPFYNMWLYFKHTMGHGWFLFLTLVPIANFVVAFMSEWKQFKGFGFGTGLCLVFMLVPFAAPIGMLICAFGSNEWCGQ